MTDEVPKAMGFCGRDLETKSWKQGTKVFCPHKGEGVVSYPNRGVFNHIRRFCGACRELGDKEA